MVRMNTIHKLCAICWGIGIVCFFQSLFLALTKDYNSDMWMLSAICKWTFTYPTFFIFIPIFIYNGFYSHVMGTFSEYIIAFKMLKNFFCKKQQA